MRLTRLLTPDSAIVIPATPERTHLVNNTGLNMIMSVYTDGTEFRCVFELDESVTGVVATRDEGGSLV